MPNELPYALTVDHRPKSTYFGQPTSWVAGSDLARRLAEAPSLPEVHIGRDGYSVIDDRPLATATLLTWARLLVEQLETATR